MSGERIMMVPDEVAYWAGKIEAALTYKEMCPFLDKFSMCLSDYPGALTNEEKWVYLGWQIDRVFPREVKPTSGCSGFDSLIDLPKKPGIPS